MGEVVEANFITSLEIPADRIINKSAEWGLKQVVIVGFDEDGEMYFASSMADTGDVLYWLEKAKWELFKTEDRLVEEGDPRGKPRGA
jgi:hypothetical protein